MGRVLIAERFFEYKLESLGDANAMLIRQYRFPDTYDEAKDKYTQVDHDRMVYDNIQKAYDCFQKHTGTGEMSFHRWALKVKPTEVIAFLMEYMPECNVKEMKPTGFRILATKNRMNGFTVWGFELFQRGKDSNTPVYSSEKAPNVQGSKPIMTMCGDVIE